MAPADAPSEVSPSQTPTDPTKRRVPALWLVLIAVLALGVRLIPILHGGGLDFYGRYDDDVYYAASDALTFGRAPYRDFVLLHPPGLILFLTPFAALGRVTSDATGLAVARVVFMMIGALNAVLVAALASRWGQRSAIIAGVMYACWMPAVYGEQSTMLEPLGGTALLVALLMLVKTRERPTVRAELVAGLALGLGCTFKIWYVAPFVTVVVWQLLATRWRAALRVTISAAVAMSIVLTPFFVIAGGRMWDMVVRDQLTRPDTEASASRTGRLASIVGVREIITHHHTTMLEVTALVSALILICVVGCLCDRSARIIVAVLAVNFGVLLSSPQYYEHYAALTAAPATLVVAIGLSRLAVPSWHHVAAVAVYAVPVALIAVSGARLITRAEGMRFPGAAFARAAPPGCVAADDPAALIEMNRLSADFRSGCRVAIDVTGITYDSLHRRYADGKTVGRRDNTAFQQYLVTYLLGARSFVVDRENDDVSPRYFKDELEEQPRLARADHLTLRAGTAH